MNRNAATPASRTTGGNHIGISARCTNWPTTAFGGSDAPVNSDLAVTVNVRTSAVPIGRRRIDVPSGTLRVAPGSRSRLEVGSEYPSAFSSSALFNEYFPGVFPWLLSSTAKSAVLHPRALGGESASVVCANG